MSMNTVGLLATAAAAALALGTSTPAKAVFIAHICDDVLCAGGNDTIITDQGPGDNFPGSVMIGQINSGTINFNGFTIVANLSQSKPLIGSATAPQMDISFSAVTSDSLSHTIFLYASDTGFSGTGSLLLTLGGTQTPAGDGNTVQGRAWGGTSNNIFDFSGSNLRANTGVLNATPFSFSVGGAMPSGFDPYSMTIGMTITRGTPGTTTGDLNVAVTPVPEPESMVLIGAGLAAMAAFKRRRRTARSPSAVLGPVPWLPWSNAP